MMNSGVLKAKPYLYIDIVRKGHLKKSLLFKFMIRVYYFFIFH